MYIIIITSHMMSYTVIISSKIQHGQGKTKDIFNVSEH